MIRPRRVSTVHYGTFRRYPVFETKWLSLYRHKYFEKKTLPFHDHPWWNVTFRVRGKVTESVIPDFNSLDRGKEKDVSNRRVIFRRATTAHKMTAEKGTLTLFLVGPSWNVVGGKA